MNVLNELSFFWHFITALWSTKRALGSSSGASRHWENPEWRRIWTYSALHRVQAPLWGCSVELGRACREQGGVWDSAAARRASHVACLNKHVLFFWSSRMFCVRCAVFKVYVNHVSFLLLLLKRSSRDRDHGGPEGMEPDGVIEVPFFLKIRFPVTNFIVLTFWLTWLQTVLRDWIYLLNNNIMYDVEEPMIEQSSLL